MDARSAIHTSLSAMDALSELDASFQIGQQAVRLKRIDEEIMSTALYKEFILRHSGVWTALIDFVKTHAKTCIAQGAPLRNIVTAEARKRNAEQNRYDWGGVLHPIAEHAWVNGKQYDAEVWHEYFARRFGLCDEVNLPDGEIVLRRKSTTQMTVGEFSDDLHAVQAYAVMRLGVEFE